MAKRTYPLELEIIAKRIFEFNSNVCKKKEKSIISYNVK